MKSELRSDSSPTMPHSTWRCSNTCQEHQTPTFQLMTHTCMLSSLRKVLRKLCSRSKHPRSRVANIPAFAQLKTQQLRSSSDAAQYTLVTLPCSRLRHLLFSSRRALAALVACIREQQPRSRTQRSSCHDWPPHGWPFGGRRAR